MFQTSFEPCLTEWCTRQGKLAGTYVASARFQEVAMSPIYAPRGFHPWSIARIIIGLLLLIVVAGALALPPAQARPAEPSAAPPAAASRVSPLAYRTDLQPLRAPDGHAIVPQSDVVGAKRVMVLRVYFHDYAASSRFTKAQ